MPRPPKDPGFFDKTNYVIDAWSRPCVAPWYIYVETMGPAALEAFITLISFGWDDVARGYWRPRGLVGKRTGKKKGKWRKALPRFPELGEEIGKRLPGADQVKGRKWGACGRFLWRIDTVVQRGLFYWLVADVTNDFAFNWTSLLYQTEWCKASDLGRFSYEKPSFDIINDGGWRLTAFQVEDYEVGPPFWNFWTGSSGPNGCTVAAAAHVIQQLPFPPPTSYTLRIWDKTRSVALTNYDDCDLTQGADNAACASAQVPPNTIFEVHAKIEGTAFARHGDGVVMGVEDD